MPGFDGTGPAAMGPMTGRGAGLCAGSYRAGYPLRRGHGPGFGRGMGNRFAAGFFAPPPADGKQALCAEIDALQARLTAMQKKLAELDAE